MYSSLGGVSRTLGCLGVRGAFGVETVTLLQRSESEYVAIILA